MPRNTSDSSTNRSKRNFCIRLFLRIVVLTLFMSVIHQERSVPSVYSQDPCNDPHTILCIETAQQAHKDALNYCEYNYAENCQNQSPLYCRFRGTYLKCLANARKQYLAALQDCRKDEEKKKCCPYGQVSCGQDCVEQSPCHACRVGRWVPLCRESQCETCVDGVCQQQCGECQTCVNRTCQPCSAEYCQTCVGGKCESTCQRGQCERCVQGECQCQCEGCQTCRDGYCQDYCPKASCQACGLDVTTGQPACLSICTACEYCDQGTCRDACDASQCQKCGLDVNTGKLSCQSICVEGQECVDGACIVKPEYLGTLSLAGDNDKGQFFTAPKNGDYTFQYVDSSYSAGNGKWCNVAVAFAGENVLWKDDGLDFNASLFAMGGCGDTMEEVVGGARGQEAKLSLEVGETITLVVGDSKSYYYDNRGSVMLDVLVQAAP